MDEKAIDAKGLRRCSRSSTASAALKDKSQLAARDRAPASRSASASLFEFGTGQDFKDSSAVIAQVDQGGLGLPDRDYYLKDDPKIRGAAPEVRGARAAHVRTGRARSRRRPRPTPRR